MDSGVKGGVHLTDQHYRKHYLSKVYFLTWFSFCTADLTGVSHQS